jgi:hypothetical protein
MRNQKKRNQTNYDASMPYVRKPMVGSFADCCARAACHVTDPPPAPHGAHSTPGITNLG